MACILLIDDDQVLRDVLAIALTRGGHTVSQAGDGKAGVACLRSHPVDLVITDLIMPGQEGIETIMQLRRERPTTPIIAMSGDLNHSPLFLSIAAKLGAEITLAKPFTIGELNSAITRVLSADRASL